MESLIVPFSMMGHGIDVDMRPTKFNGRQGIKVDEEFMPFDFDNEKLYWKNSKPTQDNLKNLQLFELTPPRIVGWNRPHRKRKTSNFQ